MFAILNTMFDLNAISRDFQLIQFNMDNILPILCALSSIGVTYMLLVMVDEAFRGIDDSFKKLKEEKKVLTREIGNSKKTIVNLKRVVYQKENEINDMKIEIERLTMTQPTE